MITQRGFSCACVTAPLVNCPGPFTCGPGFLHTGVSGRPGHLRGAGSTRLRVVSSDGATSGNRRRKARKRVPRGQVGTCNAGAVCHAARRLYVPSGDQISTRLGLIAMAPSRLDVTRRHTDALTQLRGRGRACRPTKKPRAGAGPGKATLRGKDACRSPFVAPPGASVH
jgi:hypothetical protein